MSEMMGNHCFMTRKYESALDHFEQVIEQHPENIEIRKKIIICYTKTEQLEKAINLFAEIIHENPDYIIDTDFVNDDCPCPELIKNIENKLEKNLKDYNYSTFQTLGILWLYCDLKKSIENFEKAVELNPKINTNHSILMVLKRKLMESKNILKLLGSLPS